MRDRSRAPGLLLRLLLIVAVGPMSGCSLFSAKRTVYQYDPAYGVDSPEFRRSLEVLRTDMVPGNQATVLQNGDGFFPAMLGAIRGARASVNMEMYIFREGRVAAQFAAALAEKARSGVPVRLLIDGFGSSPGPLQEQMEKAGVKVRIYHPLRIYSITRVGSRTHRRILTVDGRVGFCGGLALDDRWAGDARNPREWRDTVVSVEGPVVTQLQSIFLEDWLLTTGEVLAGDEHFPRVPSAGGMLAQAVAASRADQSSMAKLLVYMAIQAARRDIWIENAYFVPDDQIRLGLVRAVARGVDVKVIVPGEHIDIPAIRMASRYYYGELLDGGVQIFEYLPTMMHNKVMVVDGIWSTIGSINFDNRSMRKNAEVNVAVYDRDFARAMQQMFQEDLQSSETFTKEKWEKRGFMTRFSELFFWLFSENY